MNKNNNHYNISMNNIDNEYVQEQEKKKKRSNKFYIGCFVIICSIILLVVLIYNFGIKSSNLDIVPLNTEKNVEEFFEKKMEIDKNVTKENLKLVHDVALTPKFMKIKEYTKKQILQKIDKRGFQNTLHANFEREVMSKLLSCKKIDVITIEAYFILLQNIYSKHKIPFIFSIDFLCGDFKDFKMNNDSFKNEDCIRKAINDLDLCIIHFDMFISEYIPFLAIFNKNGATIYNICSKFTKNDLQRNSDMQRLMAKLESKFGNQGFEIKINDKIKIKNEYDYLVCILALARSFVLEGEMLEEEPNLIYWRLKLAQEMFFKDKK